MFGAGPSCRKAGEVLRVAERLHTQQTGMWGSRTEVLGWFALVSFRNCWWREGELQDRCVVELGLG